MGEELHITPARTADGLFAQIRNLLGQSVDALVEAGRLVVRLVDEFPGQLEALCDQHHLNPALLRRLENLGRGRIAAELLLKHGAGYRALERMPIDVQRRHLKDPVEVLVPGGDTLQIEVANLSSAQARQVFDPLQGVVRGPGAQRAWLADHARGRVAEPEAGDEPYKVARDAVRILQPVTLNRRQLLDILSRMG